MLKNFCFLYNPSANRGRSYSTFKTLKRLTESWTGVSYAITKNRDDLKNKAREAADNYEVVVACGGDGTVKDVAVSLLGTGAKLGIIPLGSGNDFSKSLGLNTKLGDAVQKLYSRRTKDIDIGKCNQYHFINTLGFGFDGQANLYASQSSIRYGILRYAFAALRTNARMEPFEVEISAEGYHTEVKQLIMVTAANGRVEGGNFRVSSKATPFDGLLNLVTIDPINKWVLPFLLPFLAADRQRWIPYISEIAIQEATLNFTKNINIHSDGEQIQTKETTFKIAIIPSAIQVIC